MLLFVLFPSLCSRFKICRALSSLPLAISQRGDSGNQAEPASNTNGATPEKKNWLTSKEVAWELKPTLKCKTQAPLYLGVLFKIAPESSPGGKSLSCCQIYFKEGFEKNSHIQLLPELHETRPFFLGEQEGKSRTDTRERPH